MMRIFASALLLSVWALCAGAPALDVPLLKELRKPVEKPVEVIEEIPVVPAPVPESARIADPATVAPGGAVWYIAAPDAARLRKNWSGSPVGKFMAEPVLAHTMRNNNFGLRQLFGDLPSSVVAPGRVAAMAGALDLAGRFVADADAMAMAGYIDKNGAFSFVFLFDVGLVRENAFGRIGEWETPFMLDNTGVQARRGDHAGNYIDVWTLDSAAVAAGFVHNILIVSNNPDLAERCLEPGENGGGESVAASQWGKTFADVVRPDNTADAAGYLRMDALLNGLEGTPLAHDAVVEWADFIGRGGRGGEALYYGLEFTEDGVKEHFLLPPPERSAGPSLLEVLSRRLKPVKKWTAHGILPYQPNPTFVFSAQLEGKTLGALLRQERRIFGSADDTEHFTVPPEARLLFSNDMLDILTGEIAIAFYPRTSEDAKTAPWILALPCTRNPAKLLPRAEGQVDYNGGAILSQEKTEWRTAPCWSPAGDALVIASEGNLIINMIDQRVSGRSFAENKDFAAAVADAEPGAGLFVYYNVPEAVVREYPDLSQSMRRLYPRSSGLNSRPPLALLRRSAKGIAGTVMPPVERVPATFATVRGPVPSLAAIAAGIVLQFPASIRLEGREDMAKSRENLQSLWLRLQLYSSRFGNFPETLADLAGDTDSALLIAPAALGELTPAEAMTQSYAYVSGVTPEDEPDIPLLYESRPWSQDFSGMYPADPARGVSESGDFQEYRQYIRLDGRVVSLPEKRFQSGIAERIAEREQGE